VRKLKGNKKAVRAIAFPQGGSRILIGLSDGVVIEWDDDDQCARCHLQGHQGTVSSVAFSPDGSHVTGCADGVAFVWEASNGRVVHKLEGASGAVTAVAFSPDGSRVATGSDSGAVVVWEVESGRALRHLQGHQGTVGSVAFSPDGTRLASGSMDGTVILWEAVELVPLFRLVHGKASIRACYCYPLNKFTYCGNDSWRVIGGVGHDTDGNFRWFMPEELLDCNAMPPFAKEVVDEEATVATPSPYP
jgi:WD40 repeat protein